VTFQDLIVTPLYLILLTGLAYLLRPLFTNAQTRKYFLPALLVRFFGAIALGIIYQFYYGGGDTFNYFTHGSAHIWEAFNSNFSDGISLLTHGGGEHPTDSSYLFSSKIWYFRDVKSYLVVRIAAFFDLFTFHTYSATALFFAVFSFSGLWAMYTSVFKLYPNAKYLHIAILFIPSVVFWGSGILKDSVTLGALGWITWAFLNFFALKRMRVLSIVVAILAGILILKIKSYILLCFAPVVFVYLYFGYLKKVRNPIVKVLVIPFLLLFFGGLGVLVADYASTGEYNIDNVAQRAAVTSYDIKYGWGARTGGDGTYDIGTLDGSWGSMLRLAPQAIIVSWFRPFIWEVRNPLMLLAALESLVFLLLIFQLIVKRRMRMVFGDPFMIFCLVFALLFSFAVGMSTGNFGTLMRYKIPMMPFLGILLINSQNRI